MSWRCRCRESRTRGRQMLQHYHPLFWGTWIEKDTKYMIVRGLTGITVCPHYSKTSCGIYSPVIRSSEFLRLRSLHILQVKVFYNILREWNKQLTLGRIILKDPWSRLAPVSEVSETDIGGLGYLGRMGYGVIWKCECSRAHEWWRVESDIHSFLNMLTVASY